MDGSFLITGGLGFIGSWVAKQLIAEGASFVSTDRSEEDGGPGELVFGQVLTPEERAKVDLRPGNIKDAAFLEKLIAESGATHIIHLAGYQTPDCAADPAEGARVNVVGTIEVFEAVRRLRAKGDDRVRNVVYASSAAVAGPPSDYDSPLLDETPHRPRSQYGVFKLADEGCARVFWQDHGIASVGLRPFVVYGVGREIGLTSSPTKAVRAAVAGESYVVPLTGMTNYNYVADVASCFVGAARSHEEGTLALNLPGEVASIRDFLDVIERVLPEAAGKLSCEGPEIPIAWDLDGTGLDRLLQSKLGGLPRTTVEEGIRKTAEHFRRIDQG